MTGQPSVESMTMCGVGDQGSSRRRTINGRRDQGMRCFVLAAAGMALASIVGCAPFRGFPDRVTSPAGDLEILALAINAKRITELDAIFLKATKALDAARAQLARADKAKAAAEAALQDAQKIADTRRADVARLEREARTADQERSRLKADARQK